MQKLLAIVIVGIGVLVAPTSAPLSAHHSQARYTGAEGAIQIRGIVVTVEMTNPHSFLYIDEIDKDGKPVLKDGEKRTWALEMQSVRGLAMNGGGDNPGQGGGTRGAT